MSGTTRAKSTWTLWRAFGVPPSVHIHTQRISLTNRTDFLVCTSFLMLHKAPDWIFSWCFSFKGFSEERLMNAAWNQMTKLPFYHSFWNRTSQPPLVPTISFFVDWLRMKVRYFSCHSLLLWNDEVLVTLQCFNQDLAKELVDMFKPVKMGKVFFCTTGSEANDTQVMKSL